MTDVTKDPTKVSTGKRVALGILGGVAALTVTDLITNREGWKNTTRSTKLAVGTTFMKK